MNSDGLTSRIDSQTPPCVPPLTTAMEIDVFNEHVHDSRGLRGALDDVRVVEERKIVEAKS